MSKGLQIILSTITNICCFRSYQHRSTEVIINTEIINMEGISSKVIFSKFQDNTFISKMNVSSFVKGLTGMQDSLAPGALGLAQRVHRSHQQPS